MNSHIQAAFHPLYFYVLIEKINKTFKNKQELSYQIFWWLKCASGKKNLVWKSCPFLLIIQEYKEIIIYVFNK